MNRWYNIRATAEGAELSIHDEIGAYGVSAKDFIAELGKLPGDAALTLRLNSPGGSVFDAVAIYNALKRHEGPVTVSIDGIAASAASYIAMAGDEVVMPENAFLMIHEARADGTLFVFERRVVKIIFHGNVLVGKTSGERVEIRPLVALDQLAQALGRQHLHLVAPLVEVPCHFQPARSKEAQDQAAVRLRLECSWTKPDRWGWPIWRRWGVRQGTSCWWATPGNCRR